MRFNSLLVATFLVAASAFASHHSGKFYTSGPSDKKRIALTFDDGPGPQTEKFIELLTAEKVKATFFVLGEQVQYKPQTVRKLVDNGFEVGSHTYNHTNYNAKYKQILAQVKSKGKGEDEAREEAKRALREDMKKSDEIIRKATGSKVTICRMPHGIDRPWISEVASEFHYALINWTYGADWTKESEDSLIKSYVRAIQPGAILLLHDGGSHREKTLAITKAVIAAARERGFEFVTVSEMLSLPQN